MIDIIETDKQIIKLEKDHNGKEHNVDKVEENIHDIQPVTPICIYTL